MNLTANQCCSSGKNHINRMCWPPPPPPPPCVIQFTATVRERSWDENKYLVASVKNVDFRIKEFWIVLFIHGSIRFPDISAHLRSTLRTKLAMKYHHLRNDRSY